MKSRTTKVKTSDGDDRYEVRVWGYVDDEFVDWRRRFKTHAEAQHFIDETLYQERQAKKDALKTGGNPLEQNTFGDEFQHWKITRQCDFAPGWRSNTDQYWQEQKARFEGLPIAKVTPAVLQTVVAELKSAGNSNSTIQRKIRFIQAVLNHSVLSERLPYNPVARFKTPKPLKPDLDFWEQAEALSFLDYALKRYPPDHREHWKYLAYLTALNAGPRAGEIWALRPRDLRESRGVINVTRQLDLVERTFRPLKGKEGRNVPLAKALNDPLKVWISRQGIGASELIFTTEGAPIDHNNFAKRAFQQDLKAWKGKVIKFHGLRHTAATLMLANGIDIGTVQKILGHKSIETTMRYVHALGDSVKNAASMFSLSPSLRQDGEPPAELKVEPQVSATHTPGRHLQLVKVK